MFSTIVFGLGAFFVAVLLTIVTVMMVPSRRKDETRPGKTFAIMFVLCMLAPFAFAEGLTFFLGKEMTPVAEDGYYESGLGGEVKYFKVIWYTPGKAKLLVVGVEPTDWGGDDRPSVAVQAVKSGGEWAIESTHVINSDRQEVDGIRFPPYW